MIRIWGEKWFWLFEPFSELFLFEPFLFEHSLKSKLAKECTKEYEGNIMVQEQWLGLANLWCLDYWKNRSRHFYVWSPGKILPKVLITPKQKKITHSPQTGFFRNLSPAEKQHGETMQWYRMFVHRHISKNTLSLLRRVYIKLLVLVVLVSASVTISCKFLKIIPRII